MPANSASDGDVPVLPLLPLRDIVVFPNMVVPLFVGRDKSISALEEAMNRDKRLVLCAQKRDTINEPTEDDIYSVGTVGNIVQLLRLPDGTVKVLVKGEDRVRADQFVEDGDHFRVELDPIETPTSTAEELADLIETLRSAFETYADLNKRIPPDALGQVDQIEDPSKLADTIVAQLSLDLDDKQSILETLDPEERLRALYELIQDEIENEAERKIRSRVKDKMEQDGEGSDDDTKNKLHQKMQDRQSVFADELEKLEERIDQKDLPDEATERLKEELKKLKMMSPMSAEATVVRNYIDRVLNLPWREMTDDRLDIDAAEETLEADHYGLEKPKDRILEYLAVRSLSETPSGTILCFVGPPGVGKTSLGRSIARATNRNFVRMSLGGVRDESEIRGHRRTYIGSMPGKIIQSLEKAGSNNPVFLLDEVDKMSADFRGDPSSAMLEVLDPEQNEAFKDHYLDLDYDLSNVMFICTANQLDPIPAPLQDRMEIIKIPGYTDYEKLQIAQEYLLPNRVEDAGLEDVDVHFTSSAVERVTEEYTSEAGVRNLERELGSVCRKIAREVVENEDDEEQSFTIRARTVPTYLGPPKFQGEEIEDENQIGMTNGLAWTQNGGVVLVNEVTVMPGNGELIITGKLGDVMQESARAAMSYVRSRALNLGLNPKFHEHVDLHVHFPEGALPKDGPSAGITMATSLVSVLTQTPVSHDVAMTGEITLRGRVLRVGGLKEKIVAAHRAGVETVMIPADNEQDLQEIPRRIKGSLEIIPVDHVDEVLPRALALENPEAFLDQLQGPLLPPDVLRNEAGDEESNPALQGVDDRQIH
ncbi:MAG: endopeptidase La [Bradymonadaceae bacterium]